MNPLDKCHGSEVPTERYVIRAPLKPGAKTIRFRIAAISDRANAFGLHGIVLVAADGECWQVGKCLCSPPENRDLWILGTDVIVPLSPRGERCWSQLGVEIPTDLGFVPYAVVAETWGLVDLQSTACDNIEDTFTPDQD